MDGAFTGFNTSAAGMSAERRRMQVITTNLANANTVRDDGPYVRRSVVFQEMLDEQSLKRRGEGVKVVDVYEDTTSKHPRVYNPGHKAADSEGFVKLPNVNVMFELVDLMAARRAYTANLSAMQSYRSMMRTAIQSIGAR